tara:strand:- start:56 stop:262 length:207 start_codon:yes stop_codon:yes gene_type:complete
MKKTVFESETEETELSIQLGIDEHILVIVQHNNFDQCSTLLCIEDAKDLVIELKKLIKIIEGNGKKTY